jgi:hypothetical protein
MAQRPQQRVSSRVVEDQAKAGVGVMGWEPMLKFADESKSFVLGFEAGRIWEALKTNDPDEAYKTFIIHGENAELMLRMAESTGRELAWRETGDPIWCTVTFAPKA